MKTGHPGLAKPIYWLYSNLCHQLPYRSWFLFGDQPNYPLVSDSQLGKRSFQEAFNFLGDLEESRNIIGSDMLGYKIAVCQRDLAIYCGILLFGLIFAASKKKISGIPFWVWLTAGVIPLGIDGILQFVSSFNFLPGFIWESTPLVRTITGGLSGIFTGGYIFPTMESLIKKNQE